MLIEHKLYPRQILRTPLIPANNPNQGSYHAGLSADVFQKGNNLSLRFAGHESATGPGRLEMLLEEPEKTKEKVRSASPDGQDGELPEYLEVPHDVAQPVTEAVREIYQPVAQEVREIWQKPFHGGVAVVNNIAESGMTVPQFMSLLGEAQKATLVGEVDFSRIGALPLGYQKSDQFVAELLKDIEKIKASSQYRLASPQQPGVLCLRNLPTSYLQALDEYAGKRHTNIHTLLETLAPNLRFLVLPAGSRAKQTEPFNLRSEQSSFDAVTLEPPTNQQWASILHQDPTFQKIVANSALSVDQAEAGRFVARTQSLFANEAVDPEAVPLTRDALLRNFQDWAVASKKTSMPGISDYYASVVKGKLPDYLSVVKPVDAVSPTQYSRLYDGLAADVAMQLNFPAEARKPFVLVESTKAPAALNDEQHFERLHSLLAAQPGHRVATIDFNAKGLQSENGKAKISAIKNAAQLLNAGYPEQNITLHLKNLPSDTLKQLLDQPGAAEELKALAPRLQFLLQPKAVTGDVLQKHEQDIQVVNSPRLKKKDWMEVLPESSQFQAVLAQNNLDISPDLLAGFVKAIHARISPGPLTEKALLRHFSAMCRQVRAEEYKQSGAGNGGRLGGWFEKFAQGSEKRNIAQQDLARYIYTAFIQQGPVSAMSFRPPDIALKSADRPEVAAWTSTYQNTSDRLNELLESPVKPLILLQAPWSHYPPHLKQAILQSLQSDGRKSVFSVDMGNALKTIRGEQELSPYDSDDSQLLSASRPSELANLLVDMATHLKQKYKLGDQKIVLMLENDLSGKMTPAFFEILAKKAPNLRLILPPANMHFHCPPPPGQDMPDFKLLAEHGTEVEIPEPTGKKWVDVLPELDDFKTILAKHKLTISKPQLERLLARIQQWDANKQGRFDLTLTKQGILSHLHDLCESIGGNDASGTREITRDDIDRYRKSALEKDKSIFDLRHRNAAAPYQIINSEELPDISLDQVIGLPSDTRALLEGALEDFNMPHPRLGKALMPKGGKGSLFQNGILLYGKPGTGKTMTGKAFAKACPGDVLFMYVNGPSLFGLQKYIGDSKENMDRFFGELKKIDAPVVVFIDEFDMGERRSLGSDGGNPVAQQEMNNLINTFLAHVDGLSSQDGPSRFFIMATNRPPSGMDPAVSRRIGNKAEVALPSAENQVKILRQELEKWHLSSPDDAQLLSLIKEGAGTEKLSGSDLANMAASLQKEVRQGLSQHQKADMEKALGLLRTDAQEHEYLKTRLVVTEDMLKAALKKAVEAKKTEESVSMDDPALLKAARLKLASENAFQAAYIEHSKAEPTPPFYQ